MANTYICKCCLNIFDSDKDIKWYLGDNDDGYHLNRVSWVLQKISRDEYKYCECKECHQFIDKIKKEEENKKEQQALARRKRNEAMKANKPKEQRETK